ncbi:restriction endonuclease subunit S [Escherichia coli]|uniref:restriction endonuclease subunit S n=1 Tax=Escherichia coli TaxID=562 RepID=UPI000E569A58|nr:restriction endonuclease subunit S [Escherichia coli]RFT90647.1 restriction endonuclease subunit S [Escherichia coli]
MSELSYLEKLLDGVEVEWKTLGEVAKYVRGLIYSKSSESADGQGYKVLRANNITLSNNCLNLNDVKVVRFDTKVKSSQKLYKNDILISAASGSREHVGKVAYIESDIDYYFGGFMGVVRCDEKLNPRYLFHVLTSDIFQKYLDEMLNSSTINNLNSAVMGRFKIPLPCPDTPEKSLAIQSEIVRILDKFTALTAELTAELTMRKKQYNYYRDQLLSFKEGEVEWKALDDVFDIVAGGDAPKDALSEFETEEFSIPVLSNGIGNKSLYGWTDRAKIEKPSLTISARGTIGWTSYRSRPFFPIVRLLVLTPKIKLNLKYAYYFMKTIENNYKIPEAGIPQLTKPMLKDIKIPFPCPGNPEESYNEQARIAATLDKFDTLTNSITEGLPREIELRQKQYEYYRDLLFSFPKPETVSN